MMNPDLSASTEPHVSELSIGEKSVDQQRREAWLASHQEKQEDLVAVKKLLDSGKVQHAVLARVMDVQEKTLKKILDGKTPRGRESIAILRAQAEALANGESIPDPSSPEKPVKEMPQFEQPIQRSASQRLTREERLAQHPDGDTDGLLYGALLAFNGAVTVDHLANALNKRSDLAMYAANIQEIIDGKAACPKEKIDEICIEIQRIAPTLQAKSQPLNRVARDRRDKPTYEQPSYLKQADKLTGGSEEAIVRALHGVQSPDPCNRPLFVSPLPTPPKATSPEPSGS